ncbi:MAG: sortase [Actinomycetota bacterium]|nr:sortase [Actinomycetota bacterium]
MTLLLAASAACTRSYGSDRQPVPPSTLGRWQDNPILAPPTTSPLPTAPTTTVPALPQPIRIPRDSYAPEPVVELGTIEIPALGLVHTVYQGVTLNNIDLGPSHWTGTAIPGQPGNTVFAGHRITHSHPFGNIDALVEGDEVIFTVAGVRSVYRVTGHMVVTPMDTWIAEQTPESTGTLYACHPPGSASYRYVVKLALVT